RATKNSYGHLYFTFLVINVLDVTIKVSKRTLFNTDHLTNFKQYFRPWFLGTLFHLRENLINLMSRYRGWTISRASQEARYPIGIFNQMPGFIGKFHFHQHITWKNPSFRNGFFTVLNLDNFLGRYKNFTERMLKLCALYPFK